jgi:DNA-binding PadR family transcriptional regulator
MNAQLDLYDRTNVVLRESEIQREHLESVSFRISGAVLEFVTRNCGLTFHADQLRKYVEQRCGYVAPGSADRILRHLKQRGLLTYSVVNRAKSLYRVGA